MSTQNTLERYALAYIKESGNTNNVVQFVSH